MSPWLFVHFFWLRNLRTNTFNLMWRHRAPGWPR